MLDVFDAGCWMFLMLDAGYWMQDIGCWIIE
jgi:hypothetical protein